MSACVEAANRYDASLAFGSANGVFVFQLRQPVRRRAGFLFLRLALLNFIVGIKGPTISVEESGR